MQQPPYAQLLFGEVHGMIEAVARRLSGEATVDEIIHHTSVSHIDAHHAVADMVGAGICDISDGTVRLIPAPPALAELVDAAVSALTAPPVRRARKRRFSKR